jgi:hypothetical protein
MPIYLASSDPLAVWGQIAAIILLLYLLVFIVIALVLALVLLLGMSWVREKIELIKLIRPVVNSVNTTTQSIIDGTLAPPREDENQIIRTAIEIPPYIHTLEKQVDQGSSRVADTVIELRARTLMTKTMLKAFFLPGLTNRPQNQLEAEGTGFRSPDYRILMEEQAPEDRSATPAQGYAGSVTASELKEAPAEGAVSPPPGPENAATP